MRILLLTGLCFFYLQGRTQTPNYPSPVEGDYIIHHFPFQSGDTTLPDLRLHYTTIGQPRKDAQGIAGRNRMLRKMAIDMVEMDPAWKGGEYTEEPRVGLTGAISSLIFMGSSPLQSQKRAPTRSTHRIKHRDMGRIPIRRFGAYTLKSYWKPLHIKVPPPR